MVHQNLARRVGKWYNGHDLAVARSGEATSGATTLSPCILGQANFNGAKLKNVIVPFPPLGEEKRIVAKVESLLALCEALAGEVATAEEVRGWLLRAVLNGA